ncbi:MAG: hypothetical protein KDE01_20255, partial [Caldilineaceae bacterium]|nr:hypothetical protein [Caldilineaceae bacterium]
MWVQIVRAGSGFRRVAAGTDLANLQYAAPTQSNKTFFPRTDHFLPKTQNFLSKKSIRPWEESWRFFPRKSQRPIGDSA